MQTQPKPSPHVGERISDYVLEEELGQWDECSLWRLSTSEANTPLLGCFVPMPSVALFAARWNPGHPERWVHPHLLPLRDILSSHDRLFVVQETGEDERLSRWLEEHDRVSESQATLWLEQLLSALAFVHRKGFSPVGLDPAWIVVLPAASQTLHRKSRASLLHRKSPPPEKRSHPDLLAQHERQTKQHQELLLDPFARFKLAAGSPIFLAPEQLDTELPSDHRTDIYACGVLFLRLLLGREGLRRVLRPHAEDGSMLNEAALLTELPTLSLRARCVIKRALALDPKLRFASADAMRSALVETGIVAPNNLGEQAKRATSAQRHSPWFAALLLLFSLYAIYSWSWPEPQPSPPPAQPSNPFTRLQPHTVPKHTTNELEAALSALPSFGSEGPLVDILVVCGWDTPANAAPLLLPFEEWLQRYGDNIRIRFVFDSTVGTEDLVQASLQAAAQSALLPFARMVLTQAPSFEAEALTSLSASLGITSSNPNRLPLQAHDRVLTLLSLRAGDLLINGLNAHRGQCATPQELMAEIDAELSAVELLLTQGVSPADALERRTQAARQLGLERGPIPIRFQQSVESNAERRFGPSPSKAVPNRQERDELIIFADLANPKSRRDCGYLVRWFRSQTDYSIKLRPITGPQADLSILWGQALLATEDDAQADALLSEHTQLPRLASRHAQARAREIWQQTWNLATQWRQTQRGKQEHALYLLMNEELISSSEPDAILDFANNQLCTLQTLQAMGLTRERQTMLLDNSRSPIPETSPYAFRGIDSLSWEDWPRLGRSDAPLVLAWTLDPSWEQNVRLFVTVQQLEERFGPLLQTVIVPTSAFSDADQRFARWQEASPEQLRLELQYLFAPRPPLRAIGPLIWHVRGTGQAPNQQELGGTGQAPNQQELGGTGQAPNQQELGGTGQAPNQQELGGTGQAPNQQELGGTGQAPNQQELGGTGQAPNQQEMWRSGSRPSPATLDGGLFIARHGERGLFGWAAPASYPSIALIEAGELLLLDEEH
ncbi:MAG: hypothetical protein RBU37_15125 [Myxococcota bacterium]|jgi:serine/threonine protein kinase|nr:hypothetical protein [Myxococcota bacterium]